MSLTKSVIKGSLTLLLMRMFFRVASIISTLVLARLLSTEDFGLVAIASSAVFLFDILSETGAVHYIIQKNRVDEEDLNTVWSLNLLLKIAVWACFVLSIPYISEYFEVPRLSNALYVISLILPISGLFNPGMYLYQKELNFKPHFKMVVIEKTVSFFVVLILAFVLRNYWAMVIGVLVSYSIKLVMTYYLHEFRPSWSLKKLNEQWSFSKWILFKGILGYIRAEFDTFIVTKSFGLSSVGGYNMMKGLSSIPAQDIIVPATQPLLSSFAKIKSDPNRLSYQITLSLFIICLAIFPIAAFLGSYHELVVYVLLGQKWVDYSIILGIMSILIFTFSFVVVFQHALTALGKIKIIFYYDLISVIFLVGILLTINLADLTEFTIFRCSLALIAVVVYTTVVMKIFSIKALYILKLMFPIVVACIIASYCTYLASPLTPNNSLIAFILSPVIFFSVYAMVIFLLFTQYKSNLEILHVKSLVRDNYKTMVSKFKKA
jgi:lipopolysaccharide exporter